MLILNYVTIGLQLLLLIGAFILKYLSSRKMGLMRYSVMLDNKLRAAFNPELIMFILVILLIILGLWQILRLRRHQLKYRNIMPWIGLVIFAIFLLLFIWLTLSTKLYINILILPILTTVLLLQVLRGILSNRKNYTNNQ